MVSALQFPSPAMPQEMRPWARAIEKAISELSGVTVSKLSEANASARAVVTTSGAVAELNRTTAESLTAVDEAILSLEGTASIADGRITYSDVAPTVDNGDGKAAGSIWWEQDGTGKIIAQYEWDGAAWNTITLSHQTISSVDLGTATVGLLDGVYIMGQTIAANKLLVGDFTNYTENGELGLPLAEGWTEVGTPGWSLSTATINTIANTPTVVSPTNALLMELVNNLRVPVTQGEQFRVSGWSQHTTFFAQIGMQFYDNAGAPLSAVIDTSLVTGSWTAFAKTITVPAGAVTGSLLLRKTAVASTIRFAKLELRRMAVGSLIVDGAIDGKTITGALIRTASSGARIELDSTNGLRGFNASSVVKTQLTTGGLFTAVDATISGTISSAASGTRFILNSTQLQFVTPNGYTGTFAAADDGSPAGAAVRITSGFGNIYIGKEAMPLGGSSSLTVNGHAQVVGDLYVSGTITDGGAWATTTPTVTAGSGTITTKSCSLKYRVVGDICYFKADISITTNGTGASTVRIDLPIAAADGAVFYGRSSGGSMLQGIVNAAATQINILTYANAYPGASGVGLAIQGWYRI